MRLPWYKKELNSRKLDANSKNLGDFWNHFPVNTQRVAKFLLQKYLFSFEIISYHPAEKCRCFLSIKSFVENIFF